MKLNSPRDLGQRTSTALLKPYGTPDLTIPQGQATGVAAKNIQILQERQDNEELANARITFELSQIVEASKYDQDSDLETIEERHGAAQKEGLAKAAGNISNTEIRNMFIQEGGVTVERNNAVMGEKVFARKSDRERGFMSNAFAEIVKNTINMQSGDQGLNTGEQMQQAIISIQLATDSMVERGVIDVESAQALVRKSQYDMAIGRLKAMDPVDQLKALEEDWTKQLPADLLRSLREAAEEKARDQQAQNRALEMSGMTITQGLEKIKEQYLKEGWDVEEYDKVRLRFLREKQDQEVGKQAMQEDLYENHYSDIFMGASRIEDIPNFEQYAMTAAQKANLQLAQDNADKRAAGELVKEFSDPVVEAILKEFIASGQDIAARKYWSENFAKLNTSDFRYWDRRLSPKKSSDPSFKPIRTTRQVMNEFLETNELDDKKRSLMWGRLEVLADEYWQEHQENMPKDLQQKWVRDEFIRVTTEIEPWYFGGDTEKLVAEMETKERTKYVTMTSFLRGAIPGISQQEAADLYSEYTVEEREQLDWLVGSNPKMESWEIWARFKAMLGKQEAGADAPVATENAAASP